jgi:endonuclease YncB( thermonuclease family)
MTRAAPALAIAFLLTLPSIAADLVGQASVIDGDTQEIHSTRIRLYGIHAPQSVKRAPRSGTRLNCATHSLRIRSATAAKYGQF